MQNTAIKNYLRSWDLARVVLLALGIFIAIQGIISKDWAFIIFGTLFLLRPVLGIGCCGTTGCNMPTPRAGKNKQEEVTYEEVH